MKEILENWKLYLDNRRVLKEMFHIDRDDLPSYFLDNLPDSVRQHIEKNGAIDFAFERYGELFPSVGMPSKWFVPLLKGKEAFFDISPGSDVNHPMRTPTQEEKRERGKSIPVLHKNWYNAFLIRIGAPLITEGPNKKARDLSLVKTLAVFDFDETLFKSDEAATRLTTDHPLSPDSLPDNPKNSDWNIDMVYKAQELCANPTVYCVMMTGRVGDHFEDKINKLLRDRNLFFAETHYNDFGNDTAEYKKQRIYQIMDKLPSVKKLIMWDDQPEKADKYTEEFASKLEFKIYLVGQES